MNGRAPFGYRKGEDGRLVVAELGVGVARGVFGARMAVELVNDGPVTIVLE